MKKLALAALCVIFISAPSCAAVVVDMSPDVIGNYQADVFNAENVAAVQNFLVEFTLTSKTALTGMDIYSSYLPNQIGDPVLIKLRNDDGGQPAQAQQAFVSAISAIDKEGAVGSPVTNRIHADFTTTLSAGTYWIGMSATADEIGWDVNFQTPSVPLWRLNGDDLQIGFTDIQASFRLEGNSASPEPSSWALMLVGFGAIGSALRGRRTAAIGIG
jgi:hypothetical protein